MVFKAVGGVEKNVYEVYKSDQTSSEVEEKALDITNKHRDHYKNRIVLAWEAFATSEVLSTQILKSSFSNSDRRGAGGRCLLENKCFSPPASMTRQ